MAERSCSETHGKGSIAFDASTPRVPVVAGFHRGISRQPAARRRQDRSLTQLALMREVDALTGARRRHDARANADGQLVFDRTRFTPRARSMASIRSSMRYGLRKKAWNEAGSRSRSDEASK